MNRLHKTAPGATPETEVGNRSEEESTEWMRGLKIGLEQLLGQPIEDLTVKAGRRNSKADQTRIQDMHDHTMALGAYCNDQNCPADSGDMSGSMPMNQGKTKAKKPAAKSTKAATEGEEPSDQAEALGLPLDKLVEAVREAFYDIRTDMRKQANLDAGRDPNAWYYEWDDDMVPCCEAVYDGYAIARIQLAYYRVAYTVEATGIVLADQDAWEQVAQEWVTKSAELLALLKQNQRNREIGAVKLLGQSRLGNYLMVWGDEQHRDLYGEFFTRKTEGLKSIFDYIGKLPALYQHAMDGVVKYDPIGTIDVLEIDPVGLWMETQLDLANQYAGAVLTLAKKKVLGASSGALPGSRKVAPNGEIQAWAIVEGSYTPTPAEPRLRELGVDVVKAIYKEVGLEFPETVLTGTGGEESRQDAELEAERLHLLELSLA